MLDLTNFGLGNLLTEDALTAHIFRPNRILIRNPCILGPGEQYRTWQVHFLTEPKWQIQALVITEQTRRLTTLILLVAASVALEFGFLRNDLTDMPPL